MDAILVLLAALLGVVALVFLLILALVARRALLTRGLGSFECSLRAETIRTSGGWRHGIARYADDRLDWFRVFGVRPRPAQVLERSRLLILDTRQPTPAETDAVLPGWVVVRCGYGAAIVELAMSEGAYNGLAAWLESAPPGQTVSIA